VLGDI